MQIQEKLKKLKTNSLKMSLNIDKAIKLVKKFRNIKNN